MNPEEWTKAYGLLSQEIESILSAYESLCMDSETDRERAGAILAHELLRRFDITRKER